MLKYSEKSDSHENHFSTRDSVKIENGQLTAIGPSSVKQLPLRSAVASYSSSAQFSFRK